MVGGEGRLEDRRRAEGKRRHASYVHSRVRETLAADKAAARSEHNLFVPVLDTGKPYAVLVVIGNVFQSGMGCLSSGLQFIGGSRRRRALGGSPPGPDEIR